MPDEVDHINAHGTATPQNDAAESKGFRRVFGDRTAQLPVTSLKSMIGHCLGAAGAIEAAALALSIARGVIPPTINHESADCDVLVVANQAARTAPARGRVDVVRIWRERCGARDSRLQLIFYGAQEIRSFSLRREFSWSLRLAVRHGTSDGTRVGSGARGRD